MSELERLRDAIRASGRPVAAIAREAGMDAGNLSKFAAGKAGISYENGKTLERVVGLCGNHTMPEADPIPDHGVSTQAGPPPCQCGQPIVVPTECRDCRMARKRTTPGTGLSVLRSDVTRVTSKAEHTAKSEEFMAKRLAKMQDSIVQRLGGPRNVPPSLGR